MQHCIPRCKACLEAHLKSSPGGAVVLLPIIVIAFGVGLVVATRPSAEQPLTANRSKLGEISTREIPLSKLDVELVMDID